MPVPYLPHSSPAAGPSFRAANNRQTIVGFIALVVLVLIMGALSFLATHSFEQASSRVEKSHMAIAQLDRVLDDLQDAETSQRGFLLTGDESFLAPYTAAVAQVAPDLRTLKGQLDAGPAQQQGFATLEQQVAARLASLDKTIALRREQGFDAARLDVLSNRDTGAAAAVRETVAQMRNEEQRLFDQRSSARNATARNQIIMLGALVAVTVGLVAALFLFVHRYITERHERERQAADLAEARYRAVGDAIPFGVWSTGADGRLTYLSQSFLDYVGMTFEEFRHHGWKVLFPPDKLQAMKDRWRTAVESRAPFEYLETFPGVDGTARAILGKSIPILGLGGEVVAYAGINLDVTEQQRAEQELRISEQRYRSLAEALPAMIASTSADGVVQYHNSRWSDFTGLKPEELRGDGWRPVVHPDDLPGLLEMWADVQAQPRAFEFDYRLLSRNGDYCWHHDVTTPVFDDHGTLAMWLSVDLDIDTQKRTEEDLRRASSAKDEFLGMVSHELRTPLTIIMGNAQALRRLAELTPEEQAGCISEIQRETDRLHRLIENMLTLSRAERGKHGSFEPMLLQRSLPQLVGLHADVDNIHVDVDDTLEPVAAEPIYLEQIVQNLVSNALKYSPPGTPIELRARRGDGGASICVSDRGPGIPADDAQHIFDPFFRSKITAGTAAGVGLGLAVCKRLVDAQGGHIWVQPREGGGTVMGFTLPFYHVEDEAAVPEADAALVK